MKNILLTTVLLATTTAFAQDRKIVRVSEKTIFTTVVPSKMDPGSIYFQYTNETVPFPTWINSGEAEFMNLHPTFKEPQYVTNRNPGGETQKMLMFTARAKTILNRPAAEIPLKEIVSLNFIRNLDPALRHTQIQANQTMPVVSGTPGIKNFDQLCNTTNGARTEDITRPTRELSLKGAQRPNEAYCSNTDRSICLESCYILPDFAMNTVAAGGLLRPAIDYYNNNMKKTPLDHKDFGVATQSELRYFVSEAEWGKKLPIKSLTGIDTPVRGIVEQNMFYFNQVVVYGKIVAVFQEHPTDASKTVVSSVLVFGMQAETFTRGFPMGLNLRTFFMGRAGFLFNTPNGLTSGLPNYTEEVAAKLVKLLEK